MPPPYGVSGIFASWAQPQHQPARRSGAQERIFLTKRHTRITQRKAEAMALTEQMAAECAADIVITVTQAPTRQTATPAPEAIERAA